jgi:type I restriction enzyme, S subunit
LLEGLEISVLKLSELNDDYRYESEFFLKRYLSEEHALARWCIKPLGNFATVTDGPHGYHVVDEASPIAMLTAKCAKDWFSDRSSADTIASWVDTENKRSSLEENDIILSTRGTVGLAALVVKESLPANIDQDVARISWGDKEIYPPEFVIAYLNSRFGQDRITRYSSGMVQQGLSLQKVREIPIPALPTIVCQAVSETVRNALQCRRSADTLLEQSEQLLVRALALENWQPLNPLTYTQSSAKAFTAGRLDAEYFRPRVCELLAILGGDGHTIGELAPARSERFTPASSGSFDYLEIGGVRMDGTVQAESVLHKEAPSRATNYVRAGDVITSTVRPIRRLSALIAPEQDGFVCSSGFVVLQPKKVAPEVLLTYLRLPVVCELMDLHTSASLYPAISEQDLLSLPMPLIDATTSDAICAAVKSSQAGRQRAAELLEAAKRAVEIAIEDSEAAALAYLHVFLPES